MSLITLSDTPPQARAYRSNTPSLVHVIFYEIPARLFMKMSESSYSHEEKV